MSQTNRIKRLMAAASKLGVVLFRNNVAKAWVGTGRAEVIRKPSRIDVFVGDVVLRKARPLHAGLFRGSHDLIGYKTVKITSAMVGQSIAIFTGVEDKGPSDKLRKEQVLFHNAIKNAGGFSCVARSTEDLEDYFKEVETILE